jgi:hypothetical protein
MIGPIADFPYLLQQVSDHMSADRTLPALNGVYFEARGAFLYAVATDRYTLAVARRRLEKRPSRPWAVLVGERELKPLRAFVGFNRRTPLTLAHRRGEDGPVLTVRAGAQSLEVPGAAFKLPGLWTGGEWRTKLAEHLHTVPDLRQDIALNPTLLARWGRSGGADRHTPVRAWTSGPGKPLVITCGADFIGLHMPVRVTADAPQRADIIAGWGDLAPTLRAA